MSPREDRPRPGDLEAATHPHEPVPSGEYVGLGLDRVERCDLCGCSFTNRSAHPARGGRQPANDVTDDLVDRHRIWDDAIETVSGDSPIGVRERLREEYDRTFARYRVAPTGYDLGYLDALDVAIVMLDGLRLPRLRRSWKLRRALIEVVNVLGPAGLCTCEAPCEELRTEAAAALAIARTALAETNTARSAG